MTIKEAFTLLANKVGSGMKNPFFISRNLHDAFAEIAEKIEGGGGPATVDAYDVTYNSSNVGAALDYINQGVQYSTTKERIVGKWIDGKPIYQKTWAYDTPLNLFYDQWVDSGIPSNSGIDTILDAKIVSGAKGIIKGVEITPGAGEHFIGIELVVNVQNRTVKYLTLKYLKSS